MSRHPLKVPIFVLDEAQPVLDFLREHHLDVGSINADRLDAQLAADMRLLCVMLADHDALADLSYRMQRAWLAEPELVALTNRCVVLPMPLDTLLLIFLDIVAIEAAPQ